MADEEPPADAQTEASGEAASTDEAASAGEGAPAEEAGSVGEAHTPEDENKDPPNPQASTPSIKNLGSTLKMSQPVVAQESGGSQSRAIVTSSQAAINLSQLKVSASATKAQSRLSQTPSVSPSLALATSRGSQVQSSKVALSPSKALNIPSRLELLENSKISLSRTGLSPSALGAGSKAVVASQTAFTASKANVNSKMGLDRTASRADRQRSLDQRVNLARQALSGSTMSIRHNIDYEAEKNKGPRYMNTYRMDSKYPFNPDKVERVLKEVFDTALADVMYEPRQAARLALSMSAEIRNRVKTFQFERYKIVVVVDIGEKQAQSLFSGFRYLWDVERDFYSMYKFENVTLFAVGCCYGVYHD